MSAVWNAVTGNGPKVPTPTDPTKVIKEQNEQTGLAGGATQAQKTGGARNQFDTQLSYQDTGQKDAYGNPIYSQSTQWGQPTRDFNSGLMGLGGQYIQGAQNRLNNPQDLSGGAAMEQATNWATQEGQRQYGIQRDRLDNQLKNQGLVPGTDAYNNAMQDLDLTNQRNIAATSAGVQNQFFNQGQTAANNDVSRFQSLTNPGLQAGFQGMNAQVNPQGTSTYNPTNAQGIYQNYDQQQMAAYQEQMKNQNAWLGAGGQVLGLALGGPIGAAAGKGLAGLGSYVTGNGSYGAAG